LVGVKGVVQAGDGGAPAVMLNNLLDSPLSVVAGFDDF
jgi:hypothetical protein